MCEVSCIPDEGLFARLLEQADKIAQASPGAAQGDQARVLELNDLLDGTEALLVKYCLFTNAVWRIGANGRLVPCAIFGGRLPGNNTIEEFGFGIVDTFENPCCCKLIADLAQFKEEFIGTDP